LDFYFNDATVKAIEYYFQSPLDFYTALYKIELLNNLIVSKGDREQFKQEIRSRKLKAKAPIVSERNKVISYSEIKIKLSNGHVINYLELSDGEHQFLNIFGTILMTDFQNSLYLLDEPETHFNPKWRREFISLLAEIVSGRRQEYFITSHSPFIVADSKREKVYLFRKPEEGILDVKYPIEETYGSDFDYILKVAFDLDTSLSKKSFDEINELMSSNNAELIQEKINEFGDSAEKLYLFKKLEQLKGSKK
jgi:restriction system-associated AAA family ATPase